MHEHEEDVASEAYLYETTTEAALTYLDGLRATWPEEHRPVLDRIASVVRSQGRVAIDGVREQLEEVAEAGRDADAARTLPLAVQEVWTGVLATQREALLAERTRVGSTTRSCARCCTGPTSRRRPSCRTGAPSPRRPRAGLRIRRRAV
jgi:hypothetical protein